MFHSHNDANSVDAWAGRDACVADSDQRNVHARLSQQAAERHVLRQALKERRIEGRRRRRTPVAPLTHTVVGSPAEAPADQLVSTV